MQWQIFTQHCNGILLLCRERKKREVTMKARVETKARLGDISTIV